MIMEKEIQLVKHKILFGYSFYPITFKGKKYLVNITSTSVGTPPHSNNIVSIYEYKENATFFRGHKGKKLTSFNYGNFNFAKEQKTPSGNRHFVVYTIKSIDSPDFERYYPEILEDIFEKLEEKWKEKEQREKKIQKNAEWDGILK